jgi:hypothetical protein
MAVSIRAGAIGSALLACLLAALALLGASPAQASPAQASPAQASPAQAAPAAPLISRQQLAALRKELNGLVGAWSHRTGQPHAVIHAELRQTCGGPALPQATADQIQARIAAIRRWAISGR